MLKIAITGNIAAGKSVVEEILRGKSYNVLDTDIVAHNLLKDESVKSKIISIFSGSDILDNGEISRHKLGRIVFGDEILRKKLEAILHPLIKKEINEFFHLNENKTMAFVSIPLLFEAKFEGLFDKIILIYANDKIRLERLMKRNNLSEAHAKNRIKIQTSQDEKVSLADYVIYNNKSIDDLRANIEKIIELF